MSDVLGAIRAELADWTGRGLARQLCAPAGIDFASNDYLDLSRDPRVVAAAHEALDEFGAGSPSARLLRGQLPVHERAERAAADWLGCDRALLVPSGWHANLAAIGALAGRGDVIVSDARNHASLVDACRLSGARVEIHAHHDPDHAARLLATARGAGRRLLVAEAVESTGGERAPLAALADVAREHDAWLVVDEAHAAGVLGPDGAGLVAATDVADRVLARVVTGGKALGVAGGFVAGPEEVVRLVLHRGRAFVFTTAVPPATAAALAAAIGVARAEPWRRARASAAAGRLRGLLRAAGLDAGTGDDAIVPVAIPDPRLAVRASRELRARGFDVRALRPPTVPEGGSRLRIVCRAAHDDASIDALAAALVDLVRPDRTVRRAATPHAHALGVVGTDTGVGKTVVAALLCRAHRRAGTPVRYLKPVQTGADADTSTVARLAGLEESETAAPLVALPLPASVDQAAAAAGVAVDGHELADRVRATIAGDPAAAWIVEGAGGLLVPVDGAVDLGDVFASALREVVVVARSGLGTLSHTLLTLEALARRRLRVRAIVLVGPRHVANEQTLRGRLDVPVVSLPLLERLDADGLDRWLDSNDHRALVS